jgi:hypothetical protein
MSEFSNNTKSEISKLKQEFLSILNEILDLMENENLLQTDTEKKNYIIYMLNCLKSNFEYLKNKSNKASEELIEDSISDFFSKNGISKILENNANKNFGIESLIDKLYNLIKLKLPDYILYSNELKLQTNIKTMKKKAEKEKAENEKFNRLVKVKESGYKSNTTSLINNLLCHLSNNKLYLLFAIIIP